MPQMRIGVVLESLNRPLRAALNLASTLGVAGVQVDAVGPLAPEALSQTGRRDFRNLLHTLSLELTALGCPLRHGFDVVDGLEARLEHVRKVLSLADDLGPRVVIVYAGAVPPEENHPVRVMLAESLTALGRHGDRVGSTLAVQAGQEPPARLRAFLERLVPASGGLGVNVDPAALLARGHEPVAAVGELRELIVHTHARDLRPGRPDRESQEVPLGHGDIDWTAYLGALEEVGYRGWLTIKRGGSADPAADVKSAVAFLRRLGA